LDRDGTLNIDSPNYVKSLDEFELIPGAVDSIKIMNDLGYKVIIQTNQSAISRGLISNYELTKIHDFLKSEVSKKGGQIDDIYFCPHHPNENCECRKPKIGNLEKAIIKYNLDPELCFFIGDSKKDIETGCNCGCHTILVLSGCHNYSTIEINMWSEKPEYVVKNIKEATKLLLSIGEKNK